MTEKKKLREPIATWYAIGSLWRIEIDPIKIVAFTEKTVTVLEKGWSFKGDVWTERRRDRTNIFPTFEEAKAAFIAMAESAVQDAKDNLQRKRTALGMVEALKQKQSEAA